jgi:DNA-binding MarR family transcriptional regulator
MRRKTKPELVGELLAAVRANQNATDQMDDAAARGMGVNRTDARCLDILEQFGPITAGRLAEWAGLTTGAVTAVIDRLVAKGYLRRVPDPNDRRRVMVEITEELEQRAGRYYGPLAELAFPFLSGYSNAELETITNFLRASTEIVEQRAREVREELDEERKRG